jgi:hypothetical protein
MFFFGGTNSVPRPYSAHLPAWQIFAQIAVFFVIILGISLAWLTIEMMLRARPAWRRANLGS